MVFQYASYAIPQAPQSSLAAFGPAYDAGQLKRYNEDAAAALANYTSKLGGTPGPYQQPQPSLASLDPSIAHPMAGSSAGPSENLTSVPAAYLSSVALHESDGNPAAVNKTTGATGLFQFLPSTWGSVAQAHPDLGLTADGITDPAQQLKAMQALTLDNARQLNAAGIQPSPGSLYAAHFLGAAGATKVLSSNPDTLIATIAPAAAAANPNIAKMTVGQFQQWAAQQGGGANGGYAPPTLDASDQPAAVGDRSADLTAYQAIDPNSGTTAAEASAPNVPPTQAANATSAVAAQSPVQSAPAAPGEPVLAYARNNIAPPSGAAPSQAPSAPQQSAQPAVQTASNGLPDRDTMLALFRSPETRPLAMQMVQAVQAGQSPAGILDMALKRAQIAEANKVASMPNMMSPGATALDANGQPTFTAPLPIPAGYQRTANGLQAISGGPEDPNNPLNAMKTGGFGQIMSGNAQVSTDNSGTPDPVQQQDFLKALPPGTASLVKGVADYQLDPTKVSSMRGNQRQQLIQMAQQYDPSFDMSQYPARSAMRKSVTSGAVSQNILAANTAIQHLSELDDIVDKLGNSPVSAFNSVKNAAAGQLGSEDNKQALSTFQQTATAAQDELAKLFKGAGASDIKTIEDWGKGLDINADPQVLHATIHNAIANLLKARLDTIDSQYQQVMGRPADFQILKPAAVAALNKMGIDPDALDPGVSNGGASGGDQAAATGQGGPPAASAARAPAKPTTDAEYAAMPSGTIFIDPDDGKQYRKP